MVLLLKNLRRLDRFSEKYNNMNITRIITGLIVLTLICAWAQYSCPYPELAQMLKNPEQYAGKRVAVFIEARVKAHTADGFRLDQRGAQLQVHSAVKNAPLDEFVSVAGIFQPPNHLHADTVHLARDRRWKMAVSVIPVLALVFLLPRALTWDRQTRTFILRRGNSL
jgi:hypothetical protein